jgi:hypothetical protein
VNRQRPICGSGSAAAVKLEFHGPKVTSEAGLLAVRGLDHARGLTGMAGQVPAASAAIRPKASTVLQGRIARRRKHPVGRPPSMSVEWHSGEPDPRRGSIVANLTWRGTAERHVRNRALGVGHDAEFAAPEPIAALFRFPVGPGSGYSAVNQGQVGRLSGKSPIRMMDVMSDKSVEQASWVQRVLGVTLPVTGHTVGTEAVGKSVAVDNPWGKLKADLEPRVQAALKADHPEASKIRAVWAFAEEKAENGDYLAAVQAGSRLETLLAANAGAGPVPAGTVAFQRSRIMWITAKQAMKQDLGKFRDAVVNLASDDEDKDEIIVAVDALVDEFEVFDTRLEDQLDQIAQAPDGPERTKLKAAAKNTVNGYIEVLGGPFFGRIDSNPFIAVNVAARGQTCLSNISAALS